MNNEGTNLARLLLLIIISTIPYTVLGQENETKMINLESRVTAQNATISESIQNSEGIREDNTIKLLFLGWLLGILQPFIIEPLKKQFDKRKFKKIAKKDIKNIMNLLESKRQSILEFSSDATLDNAIQRLTNPNGVPPLMLSYPEINTEFYLNNYIKFLEYLDNRNVTDFYQRIQILNLLGKDITQLHDNRSDSYRILFLSYLTHLRTALNEASTCCTLG